MKIVKTLLWVVGMSLAQSTVADTQTAFKDIDQSIRLREYALAVNQLQPLLRQNDPQAQFRMAGLYRSGKGVKADLELATKLYEKAALNGLAEAQYALAALLEKQDSRPRQQEALNWYQAAADQGYRKAIRKLASLNRPSTVESTIDHDFIFSAIRNNDLRQINSLINRGINLDIQDSNQRSALMIALLAGQREMSALLLPLSSHPDQPDKDLNRPLHIASSNGYTEIVSELIKAKVDINAQDSLGNTALIIATRHQNIDLIKLLLTHAADYRINNRKGQSATDIAQHLNNPGVIKIYADLGILFTKQTNSYAKVDLRAFQQSINKSSSLYKNWPLLNIASLLGETAIVQQLLDQGVDMNATDPTGHTALHRAASKGQQETLTLLLARGSPVNALNHKNETALYLAAAAGQLAAIELLIKKGADTSLLAKNNLSPLSIAISNRHNRSAHALVSAKLDEASIHTALLLAIENKMEDLSIPLIRRDSLVNHVDSNQRSALWHSANAGLIKTTTELLTNKTLNIDQTDKNGYTALARAVNNGFPEISRLLIQHGASIHTLTNENNSLLMLAVLSGRAELSAEIIAMKIDLNAKNRAGDSALMLAAATGRDSIVELLIQSGADIQTRNQDDLNAYQIAINAGHTETAELIRKHSGRLFKLFN